MLIEPGMNDALYLICCQWPSDTHDVIHIVRNNIPYRSTCPGMRDKITPNKSRHSYVIYNAISALLFAYLPSCLFALDANKMAAPLISLTNVYLY